MKIVIATKVWLRFCPSRLRARGRGQREIPQDFFSGSHHTRRQTRRLKRLKTDRIDLLQLHNIRMEQVYDDAPLEDAREIEERRKKFGTTALRWVRRLAGCMRPSIAFASANSQVSSTFTTCSSKHPGRAFHDVATEAGKDTMFSRSRDAFVRNARGQIHVRDQVFRRPIIAAIDRGAGLLNGVKKVEQLRLLENAERTLGQAALQWLLADDRVASTFAEHLQRRTARGIRQSTRHTALLTSDDMAKIEELYSANFRTRRRTAEVQGDHGAAERKLRRL